MLCPQSYTDKVVQHTLRPNAHAQTKQAELRQLLRQEVCSFLERGDTFQRTFSHQALEQQQQALLQEQQDLKSKVCHFLQTRPQHRLLKSDLSAAVQLEEAEALLAAKPGSV